MRPTPVRAPSGTPLGAPQPHPDVPSGYAFLAVADDGAPVAYDPCRLIRHVVNPRTAPPTGDAVVRQAIATVSAVTGLRFEQEGGSDEAPVREGVTGRTGQRTETRRRQAATHL